MRRPIELYYWPTPNGWKISIALEEMGLPYELRPVNIGKGEQFDPAFQVISPNGRMPAIIDPEGDEGRPLAIFESGAILQHLGRVSGRFYPANPGQRAQVEQWLFWQVGGLGPMAGQTHHFRQYAPAMVKDQRQLAYGVRRYTDEVRRLYSVLDRRLADRDYVAGDYSIADMASYPWVVPWKNQGQNIDDFPHLKRWLETIRERPATVRAYAKAKEVNPNFGQPVNRTEEERRILFGQTAAVVR